MSVRFDGMRKKRGDDMRILHSAVLAAVCLLAHLPASANGPDAAATARVGLPPPLPKPVHLSFCIFDPMGPQGKITQTATDLAKAAQDWNFFVTIKTYTDERVATEDFKAGQCEGVAISSLRARQFNATVGSIDAPGNLRNYPK